MGINDDYEEFNDETNPDGRMKYTKRSLGFTEEAGEESVIRFHGPQLSKEDREWYIKTWITGPKDKKSVQDVMGTVDKYPENCINALTILDKAAQSGRLEEYKEKLDAFYEKHVGTHDSAPHSSAIKEFFINCYLELGTPIKITDL